MPSPFTRVPIARDVNLAELYHENTKIHPYVRETEADPTGANADYPPSESLAYAPHARLALPAPAPAAMPLDAAIRARRTRRDLTGAPVRLDEVAALLSLACGPTGPASRAAPSAGARYPLEVFVAALRVEGLPEGLHHYHPESGTLEPVAEPFSPAALAKALFDPPFLRDAAALVLVAAVFPRTLVKYRERGYRLVLLEAGHAAQNLLLTAEALGLGAVPIGGFVDDELNAMADLNGVDENVLYAIALGRRADAPASVDLAAHCDAWFDAWDGDRPDLLLSFYADDATYRDPARPDGIRGKPALAKYLRKLCAAYPRMRWRRDELWPVPGGYVVAYTATVGLPDGDLVERGMDLVLLDEGGLIVRNDVHFDRARWIARAGLSP